MTQEKFFEINEFNDIYKAVGKIIESSQELEKHLKDMPFLKGLN